MKQKTTPQFTLDSVSPDDITVPPDYFSASDYDDEKGKEFVRFVQTITKHFNSDMPPIDCYRDDADELQLIDGLVRLKAAKADGRKTIEVRVLPYDAVDAKIHGYSSYFVTQDRTKRQKCVALMNELELLKKERPDHECVKLLYTSRGNKGGVEEINKTKLAELFGVSRQAVDAWIRLAAQADAPPEEDSNDDEDSSAGPKVGIRYKQEGICNRLKANPAMAEQVVMVLYSEYGTKLDGWLEKARKGQSADQSEAA